MNHQIKRAKNRELIFVCFDCGKVMEKINPHQLFCPECKIKRNDESRQRWVERNPEKVRYAKDEANRKKRERFALNPKIFTCVICGKVGKKHGKQIQCAGDCRRVTRAKREKYHYSPKTQRNGTPMNCYLCGGQLERSTHNKKYCPECEKRIASHRERRRSLQKKQTGGTHTRLEFYNLCAAYLWKCAYCGNSLTMKTVTEDHVIPLVDRGSDDISNITPACLSCNCSKNNKPVHVFMEKRHCALVI